MPSCPCQAIATIQGNPLPRILLPEPRRPFRFSFVKASFSHYLHRQAFNPAPISPIDRRACDREDPGFRDRVGRITPGSHTVAQAVQRRVSRQTRVASRTPRLVGNEWAELYPARFHLPTRGGVSTSKFQTCVWISRQFTLEYDDSIKTVIRMSSPNAGILIVADDRPFATHLCECLKKMRHHVSGVVFDASDAAGVARELRPDLALVDLDILGRPTGPEVGDQLGRQLNLPVVYLTDAAEGDLFERSQATSPYGYVLKPFDPRQLDVNVMAAVSMHEREREHRRTRVALERKVDESKYHRELMETILNSISDGIIVADTDGKFLYVNPGARQIVGMDIKDGFPDDCAERHGVYHLDRETPVKTEDLPLIRAIRHGESSDEEDVFIRNENKQDGVYIRMSGRPLLDKTGEVRGGVVIFRDVTERVLAEEALAQAFDQGRFEMFDTILHNIGNAMNSVTTGIETVRRNLENDRAGRRLFALAAAIDEHRNDWTDYIANDPQGRKVMPFIIKLAEDFGRRNDELMKTVSRVRDRANRIVDIIRTQKALDGSGMDRKDVDLYDALSGAFRMLRDSLNRRGIRTDVDCGNAPQEIRVRESQFHQMLVNLVKNSIEAIDEHAVLYGLQETPRIEIRASASDDFLYLEVIDNGIGIENNDTRVLFTPGYTTKKSGSGLGLHSAANFVIASGGRIEPLSKGRGNGTAMRVMLPLSAVAPQVESGSPT